MHIKHNNCVKFCKVYTLKKMTYIDFSHPRESKKMLEKISAARLFTLLLTGLVKEYSLKHGGVIFFATAHRDNTKQR